MSILEAHKKINIVVVIAVCVILSFGLVSGGLNLFAISAGREDIRIDTTGVVKAGDVSAEDLAVGTTIVVGSKNGSKYHLPDCPGAKNIAEKNKRYFKSVAEAKIAGYSPAANCKKLSETEYDNR